MTRIPESDWKIFSELRLLALERFSQHVLDECQQICGGKTPTAHERYGELDGLLQRRDREMAEAFDDFRRSTADICLGIIWRHGLLTDMEMSRFSLETRSAVGFEG